MTSPEALAVGFEAIPKNRGIQKMEIQFFTAENNKMLMSFGKKLVTTKMSKLVNNARLWREKTEFYFFHFPVFRYCWVMMAAFRVSLTSRQRRRIFLLLHAFSTFSVRFLCNINCYLFFCRARNSSVLCVNPQPFAPAATGDTCQSSPMACQSLIIFIAMHTSSNV